MPTYKRVYKKLYVGVECSVDGCFSDAIIKNMCRKHYNQLNRSVRRARIMKPPEEYNPTDGCPWPATTNPLFDVVL